MPALLLRFRILEEAPRSPCAQSKRHLVELGYKERALSVRKRRGFRVDGPTGTALLAGD